MTSPHPPRPVLDRRDFLRTSGAALAASLLPAAAQAASRRADDPPRTLKVGLIGCGGRGTGAALNAVRAEDGSVVLHALGDVFADRVQRCHANLLAELEPAGQTARLDVPEERRFAGFDAFRKVIESGVDVVLLAAPPHFRPEHLAAAVDAGKHVFCEKPVAVDAPGVRAVLATAAAARARSLSIVTGFCWRYNDRHREWFRRLHEGAIGDLRAFYSTYNAVPLATHARRDGWSDLEFQLRNWQHFTWLSGDHVVEQAVHSLDKQAWALRDAPPLRVVAVGGRQARRGAETGNVYDHFSATFDYGGGVKAFHMCRQMENCSTENDDHVFGAAGTGVIENWTPRHRLAGRETWEYEGDGNDMYQQELDELFASIRSGTPVNDGEWMAHSTLLAIMVRMAAYTGQTIEWQRALDSQERLGPTAYDFAMALPEPQVAVPGRTKFV